MLQFNPELYILAYVWSWVTRRLGDQHGWSV